MKNYINLILFFSILPMIVSAQRGKESNESYISISTSFNYYPKIPPYNFFVSFNSRTDDELILDYITSNSGNFTIEEGENIVVEREKTSDFPSQIIGLGAGIRIQKENNLVHEIAITKLSIVKSSYLVKFLFFKGDEIINRVFEGYNQKSGAFAFRYEIGKIFGKKRSKVKFGLVGGIEPTYYFYDRTNFTINDYPIKANLFTVDFSLIPTLTCKVGKKFFLDFKVVSSLLVADFSNSPTEQIPFIPTSMLKGETDLQAINWAFVCQFRYTIKEPKRKGRR